MRGPESPHVRVVGVWVADTDVTIAVKRAGCHTLHLYPLWETVNISLEGQRIHFWDLRY